MSTVFPTRELILMPAWFFGVLMALSLVYLAIEEVIFGDRESNIPLLTLIGAPFLFFFWAGLSFGGYMLIVGFRSAHLVSIVKGGGSLVFAILVFLFLFWLVNRIDQTDQKQEMARLSGQSPTDKDLHSENQER